jgi:hypothetical protein
MDRLAVRIGEDLDFDVTRPVDQAFDVQGGIAERGLRLVARPGQRLGNLARLAHHPHALSAAARRRLDDRRETQPPDGTGERPVALIGGHLPRHHRHSGGGHRPPGLDLGAHARDDGRRGADEHEAVLRARRRERRVLRKKAVAGMDGGGGRGAGGADQRGDREVALPRGRGTDEHGTIGGERVRRMPVGLRVDRHRLDAALTAGTDDAQGYFTPVSDQKSHVRTVSRKDAKTQRKTPGLSHAETQSRRERLGTIAFPWRLCGFA